MSMCALALTFKPGKRVNASTDRSWNVLTSQGSRVSPNHLSIFDLTTRQQKGQAQCGYFFLPRGYFFFPQKNYKESIKTFSKHKMSLTLPSEL